MNKKMRARKRRQARRVALTLVLMLTVALVSIGGTLAWLTAKTDEITNTFTVGNVDITLTETTGANYKMVPNNTIAKDPKVTVVAGSEESWLFVKITESTNLKDFISYTVASPWTQLTDNDGNAVAGVYYYDGTYTTGTAMSVLADDKVTVLSTVTKEQMEAIENNTADEPTLTFQAYACQKANVADAYTAWGYAQSAQVYPTATPNA